MNDKKITPQAPVSAKGLNFNHSSNFNIEQFKAAMAAAGITPPDEVLGDGSLYRFDIGEKKGNKAGWYVLHLDGLPAGEFGCWRTNSRQTWCSKALASCTPQELEDHRDKIKNIARQREAERLKRNDEAKAASLRIWSSAKECIDSSHPYLAKKGVKSHGLKLLGDKDAASLLIPLRLNDGLVSLQTIDSKGFKRFKSGGRVQGAYFAIGHRRSDEL